jgi:hypothetical protein
MVAPEFPDERGGKKFEISEDGDLVVGHKLKDGKTDMFKCDSRALKTYSDYFKRGVRFNSQTGHERVLLEGDQSTALYVWFHYIHAAYEMTTDEEEETKNPLENASESTLDRLFRDKITYNAKCHDIWSIIQAGDKYLFNATLLRGFFKRWYEKNVHMDDMEFEVDDARALALPCYMFDYAEGFADITKYLAYHSRGHITEKRPEGFKWKHMHFEPREFVGML